MKTHLSHSTLRKASQQGFSILELVVVITVIGILSAIVITRTVGVNQRARDSEREDDVASIVRQLEDVYTFKKLGTPAYPDTVQIVGTVAFEGTDTNIRQAPGETSSSLVVATNATATTAGVTPSPTISQYVYQPLTSLGALCESGMVCVKYNIYYRTEAVDTVWQKKSLHQQ